MNPTPTPEDAARAKYEIELFLLAGEFDLYEDERNIASLDASHCLCEISYGKLILSCWGEDWSKSWRVIDSEARPDSLRLHCSKQFGVKHCALELRRGEQAYRLAQSRAEFASWISALIESSLGFNVAQCVTARDDRRHLSGSHTRLLLKDRMSGRFAAGVAVSSSETQSTVDAALASAIIWTYSLRSSGKTVDRLFLFIPSGRATTIANRLTAVDVAGVAIKLREVDEEQSEIRASAAYDQGDLADNFKKASARAVWPGEKRLNTEAAGIVDSLRALAPEHIRARNRGGVVTLSIRGLEFANVNLKTLRIEFGAGDARVKSSNLDYDAIQELVSSILSNRTAEAADRTAEYYRLQSERWLESILRDDISVIDPALDPRFVYSQVPTYRGEQRTFIDLLAINRSGRLVVLELKVAEDPEFPFQGLDYWQRVEWHRQRGDFERRGYFPGVSISHDAPLLYLVAPLFRFHASTDLISGSISPRTPIHKIAINGNWRAGVRVLQSERLN